MAKDNLSILDIKSLIERYASDLRLLDFQAAQVKSAIADLEKMIGESPEKAISTAKAAASEAKVVTVKKEKKAAAKAVASDEPKRKPGRPAKVVVVEDPTLEGEIIIEHVSPPKEKKGKAAKAEKKTKPVKAALETAEPKKRGPKKKETTATTETAEATKLKRGRVASLTEWDNVLISALVETQKLLKSGDLIESFKEYRTKNKISEGDTRMRERLNQSLVKLNKMELIAKEDTEGRGYLYGLTEWMAKGTFPKKFH
jgi:hypothetical protein